MNPIRRLILTRRLTASLKPQPNLPAHRLAQMNPERAARYHRNRAEIAKELRL